MSQALSETCGWSYINQLTLAKKKYYNKNPSVTDFVAQLNIQLNYAGRL